MPDCFIHNCPEKTQPSNAGIVRNTKCTHPVLISDQKGIVYVRHQNTGAKFLYIPEQSLIPRYCCLLSLRTVDDFVSELNQGGRWLDFLPHGMFEGRERQINTSFQILQFYSLDVKQRHRYGVVKTISKRMVDDTAMFPLTAFNIGVSGEIYPPSRLTAFNFNKSFA